MVCSKLAISSLLICSVLGTAKYPIQGGLSVSADGEPWVCGANVPSIYTLPKPSEADLSDPNVIDNYNRVWFCHMAEVNSGAIDLRRAILQANRKGHIIAQDFDWFPVTLDFIANLVPWAYFDKNIQTYGWKDHDQWQFPEDGDLVYLELHEEYPALNIVASALGRDDQVILEIPWSGKKNKEVDTTLIKIKPFNLPKDENSTTKQINEISEIVEDIEKQKEEVNNTEPVNDTKSFNRTLASNETVIIHETVVLNDTGLYHHSYDLEVSAAIALKEHVQQIVNRTQQVIMNQAATSILSILNEGDSPEQRVSLIQALLATALREIQVLADNLSSLFVQAVEESIAASAVLADVIVDLQHGNPLNKTVIDIFESLDTEKNPGTYPQDLADVIIDSVNGFHPQHRVDAANAAL